MPLLTHDKNMVVSKVKIDKGKLRQFRMGYQGHTHLRRQPTICLTHAMHNLPKDNEVGRDEGSRCNNGGGYPGQTQ